MKAIEIKGAAPGVELAADGQTVVTRHEVLARGLVAIGRKLCEERAADDSAGRRHRRLNLTEMRALHYLDGEGIERDLATRAR